MMYGRSKLPLLNKENQCWYVCSIVDFAIHGFGWSPIFVSKGVLKLRWNMVFQNRLLIAGWKAQIVYREFLNGWRADVLPEVSKTSTSAKMHDFKSLSMIERLWHRLVAWRQSWDIRKGNRRHESFELCRLYPHFPLHRPGRICFGIQDLRLADARGAFFRPA